MNFTKTLRTLALAAAGALCFTGTANAALIFNGVTYTLSQQSGTTTSGTMRLTITGINGASDTEGGRYGVESFAFKGDIASVVAPSGFTTVPGGLNSSGCNGSGAGFFCFDGATPAGPALAANSSLFFDFGVTLSAGTLAAWEPEFKINWVGTARNYNLVSVNIPSGGVCTSDCTSVPEPMTLGLLSLGLVGAALGARRRRMI